MTESPIEGFGTIIRREWPRVVATLARDFGDLAEAEDAAQDAVEQALRAWRTAGVPDNPGAWLTTVARRRAIDRLRRASRGREKTELAARLDERLGSSDLDDLDLDATMLRDDQLRLIFACCHPALTPEAQMALTLRSVGGLTTREIAAGFVVSESTMAQRLVRAKKKIAAAAIPFRIPPDAELLARTEIVRTVVYLIFTEGHLSAEGDELIRTDLCAEAIRLAALLVELTPDDPESLGLWAHLVLTDARRAARLDSDGELVLLSDQDRALWDEGKILRGTEVLDQALRLGRPGPLQIQAAISALHAAAPTAAETDWEQIELLYRQLFQLNPSPVVRLNHAVAVHEAGHVSGALEMLDDPLLAQALDDYRPYHVARGKLLADTAPELALAALERAAEFPASGPEQRHLDVVLAELRRS